MHYTRSAKDKDMFYALVADADRRRESRRPAGAPAVASRLIGGKEIGRHEVLVSDVSSRGVGLRSAVPLDKGAEYKLQILGENAWLIRIVRSRPRLDGTFDVGAINL
ncbi:MAG TPA: hypothetical protein VIM11_01120 [Tepidisphaeraceae bacterium]